MLRQGSLWTGMGTLFEAIPITPVEWRDVLLGGAYALRPVPEPVPEVAETRQDQAGERRIRETLQTHVNKG